MTHKSILSLLLLLTSPHLAQAQFSTDFAAWVQAEGLKLAAAPLLPTPSHVTTPLNLSQRAQHFDFTTMTTLDPATWVVENDVVNNSSEIAAYMAANVDLKPGVGLELWAHKGGVNTQGKPWTGGWVQMQTAAATTLNLVGGCSVMRAIGVPAGHGLWDGLWMLHADGRWPPEIDLKESGGNDPNLVFSSEHYYYNGSNSAGTRMPFDPSAAAHDYMVCVTAANMTYFMDGVPYKLVQTPPQFAATPWRPMFDLTVGTQWPSGAPDANTPNDAKITVLSYDWYPPTANPVFTNAGRDEITVDAHMATAASDNPLVGLYLDGVLVAIQRLDTSPSTLTFPISFNRLATTPKTIGVSLMNPYYADGNGGYQYNTRRLWIDAIAVDEKSVPLTATPTEVGYAHPSTLTVSFPAL